MDYVNKNSNDTIGNRTRDLAACSAVPRMREVNRENQADEVKNRFFPAAPEQHYFHFRCLQRANTAFKTSYVYSTYFDYENYIKATQY
jgi:hypothetical protein